MRLTDTIAGEEVHFEPNGPGHLISIEAGNGRHYEFELTETDLRLVSDRLLRYMADIDLAQPLPCMGSHMPAVGDERVTPAQRRAELREDARRLGPAGGVAWRLGGVGHIDELAEARYDVESDGAA